MWKGYDYIENKEKKIERSLSRRPTRAEKNTTTAQENTNSSKEMTKEKMNHKISAFQSSELRSEIPLDYWHNDAHNADKNWTLS